MARGEIKIPIAVDTSGVQKEINNGLVEPLEDAEDALKSLSKVDAGRDLERDLEKAGKATDELKDELDDTRDQLKKLGYAAKDAGDDAKRGMNRAEEGVEEFGDEARSTAKEAAASFDGSAESIIDAFQEVAANAFAGFGPAGLLAGLAIAAGIGMAVQAFQQAEEAAEELRQKTLDYADAAIDAGVSTETWLRASEQVVERIRVLQDTRDNGPRLWFMDDPDNLEKWVDGLRDMGRETSEVEEVLSGSTDAMKDYRDAIDESRDALKDQYDALIETGDAATDADRKKMDGILEQLGATDDLLNLLDDEIELREKSEDAAKTQAQAGVDAARERAEAEEEMADRIASAEEAVTESVLSAYDSMRDAATEYATNEKGALNIERWLEYIHEHRAATASYRDNLQRMKLTPEQWSNLMEMPEDARAQWVSQFVALPENARAPYAAALNDLGSSGGSSAAVAFNESFDPNADVDINAKTNKAESDLSALTKKKRVAEIKADLIGEKSVREGLAALTRRRTVVIDARVDTSRASSSLAAWRRNQESRPVRLRVEKTGGDWD
jgi:hypothetical protein